MKTSRLRFAAWTILFSMLWGLIIFVSLYQDFKVHSDPRLIWFAALFLLIYHLLWGLSLGVVLTAKNDLWKWARFVVFGLGFGLFPVFLSLGIFLRLGLALSRVNTMSVLPWILILALVFLVFVVIFGKIKEMRNLRSTAEWPRN